MIAVQKATGKIVAGKHRWLAARQCGLKEVPVIWLDITEKEALRMMLADNQTARLGEDDPLALIQLLEEIRADEGDLIGTAFDDEALGALLADIGDDYRTRSKTLRGDEEKKSKPEAVLKDRFEILITCDSEAQQADLLQRFETEGLQCRALLS